MKSLLVLVVTCALVGCTMVQAQPPPCSDVTTGAAPNKIPLPSLPTNQFKAVVRAEIADKQMTVEATEYVDETHNVAALKVVQQGVVGTILMSYDTDEVFYMYPASVLGAAGSLVAGPQSCEKKNLSTDSTLDLFGMKTDTSGKYPHLYSTSRILQFINGTETYKGQKTVSGIPANQWSSCVHWNDSHATFTLDYYFTVPGWVTPSGLDQIPLRAEIHGQTVLPNGTSWYFHHIYQYVNFESYVNDPETIFQTPPGVFCENRKSTRQLPKLNSHFYYREEISNPPSSGFALLQETDIWYDYDLQLIRFDRRSQATGVSRDFSLSKGPFTTIHDYRIGVQYTIAQDLGTCSIDPIPTDARGFDAVYNLTRQHLGMRTPMQFFNLDKKGFQYAGSRMARGQKCDVFQNLLNTIPGHGVVLYEVYFLTGADDVPDRGTDDTPLTVIPMRIMMWESNQLVSEYEIHDFDQDNPLSTNFDITPCFPGEESLDFELFFHVRDTNLMPQMAPSLKQLVTLAVAISSGITPIRLQKARLHWDRWNVYFQGTILDAAPSLAKFEQSSGYSMAVGLGKSLSNIYTASDCAAQCDNLQEWNCIQFDYCGGTKVCTLGRFTNVSSLINNTACSHYRRVLGGWYDSQSSLTQIWTSLKNSVYSHQLGVALPLPDANGKVDMSIDTDTLDDTQKLTFTAFAITDQVVSNVNRNPVSNNVMNQFQVIPNAMGKGYDTLLRGLSVDDCATNCIGEPTYTCNSFHYCWDAGTCFLSKTHPDDRPDTLRNSSACDLYYRNYTSNFQQFKGLTVVSNSQTIYQNVMSPNQCAKLCTYYSAFRCESFDYCMDINACFLSHTHYYDAPKSNIKQAPNCAHYSRNYIQDFIVKSHKQVQLRDNRIIQDVTPAQCAKLCVKEGSFQCNSFDYCGNYTECRLSDAGVGQVTLEPTAYCDVYSRQYGLAPTVPTQAPTANPGNKGTTSNPGNRRTTNNPYNPGNRGTTHQPGTGGNTNHGGQSQSQTSSSSGYSGGAMGGLAIAMVAVGLILGIVAIVLYTKFFTKRPDDGMTVAFSKQMETVST